MKVLAQDGKIILYGLLGGVKVEGRDTRTHIISSGGLSISLQITSLSRSGNP